jgi:hypothetical protein
MSSVAHLEGKRTGRPKGSKTTPPWVRDALWAYRNLDKPDLKPPSLLAGLLLAMGREHPDRLVLLLDALDRGMEERGCKDGEGPEPSGVAPSRYSVRLDGVSEQEHLVPAIRAIMDAARLEWGEAAGAVNCPPRIIARGLTLEAATKMKRRLQEAGAEVTVMAER